MQKTNLATADFNDIVFEGRNKDYGAYYLRRIYSRNITYALSIAIAFLLLVLFSPQIISALIPEKPVEIVETKTVTINQLDAPPPLDETKPPPPPIDIPPPPQEIVKFVPPKITEKQVDEEPPPKIEDMKNTVTSNVSQEGDVNLKYEPPKEVVVIKQPEPENTIYEFVDQQPEYPGGYEAFQKWLQSHINYPQFAQENNIQGTVYLKAVVGTDGSISEVQVLKGVNGLTDEAVRVLKNSPKWNPGKQNGRAVKVRLTVPIKFVLQ